MNIIKDQLVDNDTSHISHNIKCGHGKASAYSFDR